MDAFLHIKKLLPQLKLTFEDIVIATSYDLELKKLYKDIRLDSDKYSGYSIHDGCILFGTRLWIPTHFQSHVGEYLHIEHVGAFKMKALVLSYHVYWPSIDEDIEKLVKNCTQCNELQMKILVKSWKVPEKQWEKVYIDYGGPFMGNMFFLVVDEYSLWPEVFITNSSSASNTIEKLKFLFSKHGQPKALVSVNTTSFMEEEFQNFLDGVGLLLNTCVPHNAPSYDNLIKFVFTLKRALMELNGMVGSVEDNLNTLLFTYRFSQTISARANSAKMILGRELTQKLPRQLVQRRQLKRIIKPRERLNL